MTLTSATERRAADTRVLTTLLAAASAQGASDLHIRVGGPPLLRIGGALVPLEMPALDEAACEGLVEACFQRERDREAFLEHQECDFAFDDAQAGRFRGNAYRTKGSAAVVLRHVREKVPSLRDLGHPDSVAALADVHEGLVLVGGPTGSGKSTTLASMVDRINRTRRCHILTIEDPIEFVHRDITASVSQREIHTDTEDFPTALRSGLRQDPDVILVGEIRDRETVRTALQAAETGHLVLASIHAKSTTEAVNRVVDFFEAAEQRQARTSLAEALRGVVIQRLVSDAQDPGRRVPALEVLVNTARVREAIIDPEKSIELPDIVADGKYYGMHTMEQDLVRLVLAGSVSEDDAIHVVTNAADFTVALKRAGYNRIERTA